MTVTVGGDWRFKPLRAAVKKKAETVLRLLNKKRVNLEIYLISGRTPDVLAYPAVSGFPAPQVKKGERPVGEIFLNAASLVKRKEEWDRFLVHGILHLVGYNHKKTEDWKKMEKRELSIRNRLKGSK